MVYLVTGIWISANLISEMEARFSGFSQIPLHEHQAQTIIKMKSNVPIEVEIMTITILLKITHLFFIAMSHYF